MKFKLIYDGELRPGQRGRGLAALKTGIRRQFSPQLEELWRTHQDLKVLIDPDTNQYFGQGYIDRSGPGAIARTHRVGSCSFVPLLRRANRMLCSLEITLLLRQPPFRTTFTSGDLDNRIKTLIDGLKKPSQIAEHHGNADETLHCLLEDDDLISEFSVTCDQLLAPKRSDQAERDVVAIIAVEVLDTTPDLPTIKGHAFALING